MRRFLLLIGTFILISIMLGSCGGDSGTTPSTNKAPNTPTLDGPSGAPSNGATGVSLTPTLRWLCTDPDGDALKYTVSFGTATPPPVVSTDQTASSYTPASLVNNTTYYWSVKAKDPAGAVSSSEVWGFTTLATTSETVSTPNAPSGPTSGLIDSSLDYSLTGAISSEGHSVEYRIDWGDGPTSLWSPTTTGGHAWTLPGTYGIKLQARCVTHPLIISDWSVLTLVTITSPVVETISTPGTPIGLGSAVENSSINFAVAASTSSYGHSVTYRWDFDDGVPSSWSSGRSRSHSWSTAGTYTVKAQARCDTHNDIMSDWSPEKSVLITVAAAETVSPPDAPSAPATGTTNVNVIITNNGGAVSSEGHNLEYRFDYGDGQVSNWWYNYTNIQHKYTVAGTYNVAMQARCRTHTTIESNWSTPAVIEISDPPETIVSPPVVINGVTAGIINDHYEYTIFHSTITSTGDPIEGQFDWGDGAFSAWSTTYPYGKSHTWTTEGTYTVRYQARCSIHNELTADAESLVVTITTTAVETIDKPGYINWPLSKRSPEVNIPVNYYAYGSNSSLGHDVEVRFDWGDETPQSDWVPKGTQVSKTWTVAGIYPLTRQVRCATHNEVVSEWSAPQNITPRDPETVSTPNPPTGPDSAIISDLVYFTATGGESSYSHSDIEYRFIWGNGSDTTAWSATASQSHRFYLRGDFEVKAQARCVQSIHAPIESEWSVASVINIDEEVVLGNENIYGPDFGAINVSLTFDLDQYRPARTSLGHVVEYQFDLGDGFISDWATPDSVMHTYTTAGVYSLIYRARCSEDPHIMSDWSTVPHSIEITDAAEIVTDPDRPLKSYGTLTVGTQIHFNISGSHSTFGDDLEYQVTFGDGTIADWEAGSYSTPASGFTLPATHTYTVAGTYNITVQARCATHPSVVSNVSETLTLTIAE